MRILLDTHLLLWSLAQPSKLSATIRRKIDAADVYVSAASIWEISIKSKLGKLDANPREVLDGIEPAGFSPERIWIERGNPLIRTRPCVGILDSVWSGLKLVVRNEPR